MDEAHIGIISSRVSLSDGRLAIDSVSFRAVRHGVKALSSPAKGLRKLEGAFTILKLALELSLFHSG